MCYYVALSSTISKIHRECYRSRFVIQIAKISFSSGQMDLNILISDNWEKENEKRPKTVFPERNVTGRRRERRKRRRM